LLQILPPDASARGYPADELKLRQPLGGRFWGPGRRRLTMRHCKAVVGDLASYASQPYSAAANCYTGVGLLYRRHVYSTMTLRYTPAVVVGTSFIQLYERFLYSHSAYGYTLGICKAVDVTSEQLYRAIPYS
jgi:hypothetical protein